MPNDPPPITPEATLACIARQSKAALRFRALAVAMKIDPEDAGSLAELGRAVEALRGAGSVHRWPFKGHDCVTLSSIAAYRFGLRLSPSSTRWVELTSNDWPDRNKARHTEDGREILCEADMTEEPPGELDRVPDERHYKEDDPGHGQARAIREERLAGLKRPTLILLGCQPWTPENHERAPGEHVLDPEDDPRKPDGAPVAGKASRRMPKARPPCPVCNGRELTALISLVPVKLGKNRAEVAPEIVDGGEYCGRCGRSYQDSIWPRVTKPDDNNGNTNGKK